MREAGHMAYSRGVGLASFFSVPSYLRMNGTRPVSLPGDGLLAPSGCDRGSGERQAEVPDPDKPVAAADDGADGMTATWFHRGWCHFPHPAHEPTVRVEDGDLPEPVEHQPLAGHVQAQHRAGQLTSTRPGNSRRCHVHITPPKQRSAAPPQQEQSPPPRAASQRSRRGRRPAGSPATTPPRAAASRPRT